jgi:phosphoribosylglycinamide formyltransferase-1
MRADTRIAVLASGRGSNLRALLEAQAADRLGGGRIVGVFGDRSDAGAIEIARDAGIATWSTSPARFATREAFDERLMDAVLASAPDLVVCAGYMRVLSADAVARAQGRMINIHPSLLPKHAGLRTHARALAAGDTEHGCSVHQVTATVDGGPVIAQARVPVHRDDTAESLAMRVLAREHALLVAVVRAIAEGQLTLDASGVASRGNPLHAPLSLTDNDLLEGLR